MKQTTKAFWVWWTHYPIIAIMPAESAGKAKYASLALIQDSYSDASIIEMSARRAPEFDALAQCDMLITNKRQRKIIRGAIANALEDWVADKNLDPGWKMQVGQHD